MPIYEYQCTECGYQTEVLQKLSLGSELIPQLSQGEFSVKIRLPAGTPLAESDRAVREVQAVAAELERIMDGDHTPAEFFVRPTDEFAVTSGVAVSYGTLGLRLDGA